MDMLSRIGRIARIGSFVEVLLTIDMDKSALAAIDLQIALTKFQNPVSLLKLFYNLEDISRYEFANKTKGLKGYNQHRDACFSIMYPQISRIFRTNITGLQNWFANTVYLYIVEDRTKTQKMWGTLIKILTKTDQTEEEKMIGLSLLYMAKIEGFFEQDIRLCYSLLKLAQGKPVDMDKISKMKISNIQQYFIDNKIGAEIFDGWSGHLRNSIAHFSFSYDGNRNVMIYEDRYWDKKKNNYSYWSEEYTFPQLLDLSQKLVNVNELITVLFSLIFICDACFANDTWK